MRSVVVVVVMLALVACAPAVVLSGGGDDGEPPARPVGEPYIKGRVRELSVTTPVTENCGPADPDGDGAVSSDDPPVCNPDPDHHGGFLVVRDGGGAGEDKAYVSVPESAGIARLQADGSTVAARFTDINNGSRVAVWITGEVMESYPVQVGATYVLVEG